MLTLSTPLLAPQLVATLWPSLSLPDVRLAARLEQSVEHLLTRWDGPSGLRGRTAQRGWTRFCNNPRVDTTTLFRAATDQTIRAIANVKVLVLAHDTSEIDKHGRAEPDDAGPLRSAHSRGYLLHGCTAIDLATGARLGVLDAMAWTRSWKLRKKDHGTRAPHKKESIKWRRGLRRADAILRAVPSLQVVFHAMDREGDVHENFAYALRHKVTVVARAEHDRRVQGAHAKLFPQCQISCRPVATGWRPPGLTSWGRRTGLDAQVFEGVQVADGAAVDGASRDEREGTLEGGWDLALGALGVVARGGYARRDDARARS